MYQDTGGVSAQPQSTNNTNEYTVTEFNGNWDIFMSFGSLTALNMSGLEISSLTGFPQLPQLEKVYIFGLKFKLLVGAFQE